MTQPLVTTVVKYGITYSIMINPSDDKYYVCCEVPDTKWIMLKILGLPLIPWKKSYYREVYMVGEGTEWSASDHWDPSKCTSRYRLQMSTDDITIILTLQSLTITHAANVLNEVIL